MSPHAHVRCLHVPCSRRWPMLMPSGTWQSPWAREMLSRTSRKNPGKSNINIITVCYICTSIWYSQTGQVQSIYGAVCGGRHRGVLHCPGNTWRPLRLIRVIVTLPRPRPRSRGAPTSRRLYSTLTRQSRLAMMRQVSTPGAGNTFQNHVL